MNTKIKTFLLAGLCLVSILLPLVGSPVAHALEADKITPKQTALAWQIGLALSNCSRDASFDENQTAAELDKGAIFNRSFDLSDWNGDPKKVGYLVDTEDGVIKCDDDDDIKMMFDKVDLVPSDFLEELGIYKPNASNSAFTAVLRGPEAAGKIKDYFEKTYSFSYDNGLGAATKYILYKATFDKACIQEERKSGTEVDIVDTSGDHKVRTFMVNEGSFAVGYSVGGSENEMTCAQIIKGMHDTYQAYADKMRALATLGVNTDDDGTNTGSGNTASDNNPPCEAIGLTLGWILCPVVNALSESADFIFSVLIRPLLVARDNGYTDPGQPLYQVWSSFRTIANILLIIALLVVVFGQSIGGGMIDSYTAKKMLPRILMVAILINISIYLVTFAIDVTNVIGAGINNLMYAPFQANNEFKLRIGTGAGAAIGIPVLIAGVFASAAGATAVGGILVSALPSVALFVVLPAVLAMIGVFVTLIIRQGLIILLVIMSPVALAAYVLPNTEKYFKQWWGLLFKTLLVYPIVMVIFAVADILAVVISGSLPLAVDWLGDLIAIALMVIPLFMIPFAFKMAGGAIGTLYGAINGFNNRGTEAIKGNVNDPYSLRNTTKRRAGNQFLRAREIAVDKKIGNQKSGKFSPLTSIAGTIAGTGNYENLRSRRNEEASKMVQGQVATGGDSTVRSLFAKQLRYRTAPDADGNTEIKTGWFGTGARVGEDGVVIGATSPQFSDYEVSKARQLFGKDESLYQAALTYEIGKAGSDQELKTIMDRNLENTQSLGLQHAEGSIWIGSAYAHQQTRRELKHTKIKDGVDANGKPTKIYDRDGRLFAREVAENVNNYPLSNMRTSTIKALQDDYEKAQKKIAAHEADPSTVSAQDLADAQETKRYITTTADTLNSRMQSRGSYALEDEDGALISGAQTGAAGLVNEEINKLVDMAATPTPNGGPRQGGGTPQPPSSGPGIIIPPSGYTGSQG